MDNWELKLNINNKTFMSVYIYKQMSIHSPKKVKLSKGKI